MVPIRLVRRPECLQDLQYIHVPSCNVIDLGSFAGERRSLQDMETLIWLDE